MSALLIRTILISPLSDELPPKAILPNICQLLGHQMPLPSRRAASVEKELQLRGLAIGQGHRVSCVLGSGTLKSRSQNPGNKKKLVTARPVRIRGGLPILGHRVARQLRRLRPFIAGEISCGFYEIRPKEQVV